MNERKQAQPVTLVTVDGQDADREHPESPERAYLITRRRALLMELAALEALLGIGKAKPNGATPRPLVSTNG